MLSVHAVSVPVSFSFLPTKICQSLEMNPDFLIWSGTLDHTCDFKLRINSVVPSRLQSWRSLTPQMCVCHAARRQWRRSVSGERETFTTARRRRLGPERWNASEPSRPGVQYRLAVPPRWKQTSRRAGGGTEERRWQRRGWAGSWLHHFGSGRSLLSAVQSQSFAFTSDHNGEIRCHWAFLIPSVSKHLPFASSWHYTLHVHVHDLTCGHICTRDHWSLKPSEVCTTPADACLSLLRYSFRLKKHFKHQSLWHFSGIIFKGAMSDF